MRYPWPMATIVTTAQLEVATQNAPGSLVDDAFVDWVLEEASGLVCDTARHPEWELDPTTAPRTAKRICLLVAKRTYENPGAVVMEGGVGPIGGDRVLDAQAMGLMLTEAEEEELIDLRGMPGSDPGGLWLQPINDDRNRDRTAYLFDDSGSDWAIPYGDFDTTDAFTTPDDVIL